MPESSPRSWGCFYQDEPRPRYGEVFPTLVGCFQQPTTTIMRHFFALSDSFTGPSPAEYTSGFANRGEAIAFSSAGKRAAWLASTRLLKARAITRPEAIKLTPTLKSEWTPSYLKGLKSVSLHDIDAEGRAVETGGVLLQDYSI